VYVDDINDADTVYQFAIRLRDQARKSAPEATSRWPTSSTYGGHTQTGPSPTRIEFSTPLPLDECERRLRDAVDTRRFTFWSESHYTQTEVVGSVTGNSFKIRKRGRQANSFAPVLAGRMESAPSGTVVKARFRMPLFTLVFMFVFPIFAASFMSAGFGWAPIIIPLVIAASLFLMYAATRKHASQERTYLRDFLLATLNAQTS